MSSPVVAEPALAGSAARVMLEILIHGPLSRVELAERLGLSSPSLTRLTKPLIAAGRLFEGAPQVRSAGRPLQPLDLDPASEHFAGVKVTADAVHGVITDLRGAVRAERDEPLAGHAPGVVADAIAAIVRTLGASFAPLTGVGISLGGNSADGRTVGESHFLEWADVPLADLVEQRLGLPVVVANDVNALTQAQHWFGAGRGLDTFTVVTIGAGIGMGLVAGGELVPGAHGALGSIGHQLLTRSEAVCWRGHHGCASALLTTDAIERAAAAAGVDGADGEAPADAPERADETDGAATPAEPFAPGDFDAILRGAERGDRVLRRVVDDAGAALGLLLASVSNILDPQKIVLAGEGARLGVVGEHAMLAAFAEATLWDSVTTPIEVQPFTFTEWARGAAATAIRARMLRDLPTA
jgi:predicted NBD/HSP70 family sugar kinase